MIESTPAIHSMNAAKGPVLQEVMITDPGFKFKLSNDSSCIKLYKWNPPDAVPFIS